MLQEKKLEGMTYDGRPIEKVSQYVEETEVDGKKDVEKHHQVIVQFADGKEPGAEIMHEEEFEAMKCQGEKEHERSYLFQEATFNLQSRLMKELETWNPRWAEIEPILNRIRFAQEEVLDLALHGIFGKPKDKVTFKDLESAITASGAEVRTGVLTNIVGELYDFLKEKDYPIADVQNAIALLFDLMGSLKAQAIQSATGVPFSHLRLDHVVEQAEKGQKLALEEAKKEGEVSEDGSEEKTV